MAADQVESSLVGVNYMQHVLGARRGLGSENGSFDHQAPRRNAGNRDVGLEECVPTAKRLPGNHMNLKPPPKGHVETFRQRRATGVGLDLKLGTREDHAVEAQACESDQDRGPRPVLQREAQPVRL